MRNFSIQPLTPDRVFLAYPLVRSALAEVTLAGWTAFAGALLCDEGPRPEGGILTVANESGVIVGLVAYRGRADLVEGKVLDVERLLAFELLDRQGVAGLIAEALEAEAARLGCRAIHTCLPVVEGEQRPGWLVALLQARGHHVASMSLCKRLAAG
ncbi:MAG: GNAT family N-acetyltransferase [Tistlia sp.]|uniref:GNAT family N-acetyltransferase n=1 Tax=Tistlia sp. TaxID=3057121 RepID=UPI0034A4DE00